MFAVLHTTYPCKLGMNMGELDESAVPALPASHAVSESSCSFAFEHSFM